MFAISHRVLEGHRFAVARVPRGAALLSWGYAFGVAVEDLAPGAYVANAKMLDSLRRHGAGRGGGLPASANFKDCGVVAHALQAGSRAAFVPAAQVPRDAGTRTFMGYARRRRNGGGVSSVGTRNYIILVGTSAASKPFVEVLEKRLEHLALSANRRPPRRGASETLRRKTRVLLHPNLDGIVAVSHTEGVKHGANNEDLVLRTLAGYCVHPNVAAVLLVDYGKATESVTAADVLARIRVRRGQQAQQQQQQQQQHHHHQQPSTDASASASNSSNNRSNNTKNHHHRRIKHLRLTGNFQADLESASAIVTRELLPRVLAEDKRTRQPLKYLRLAQQCGGSDAFSGVSANPIIGNVAERIVRQGGMAVIAETDELMGAEAHMLAKVRDYATAQAFLKTIDVFRTRMAQYDQSAEQNPSGGNNIRGI